MKCTSKIATFGCCGLVLATLIVAGVSPAAAQMPGQYTQQRTNRYPGNSGEAYGNRARRTAYQAPMSNAPLNDATMSEPMVEGQPASIEPRASQPTMGYRSTAPRMAQAPAWHRPPNTQMAGRVQPSSMRMQQGPMPGGGGVFPFEEDRVEQVQPGKPMPGGDPLGPQDFGPHGGPMEEGPYFEENFCADGSCTGGWHDGDWSEPGFGYGSGWQRPCCDGPDPMMCERFAACSPWSFLNESNVSAGVQGFKGPVDFGRVGNFGFNQSLNLVDSIWHSMGIGYQIGVRFTESNFSGDQAIGIPRQSTRYQTFVTAGLFHRAFYGQGWQYGVVADYMTDHYYYDNGQTADLVQVRTELSYIWCNGHEIGFTGMIGSQDSDVTVAGANQRITALDQYRGFYRVNFCNGAYARSWFGGLGGAGAAQAVLGADYRVPIHNRFDITGNFNYLIPTANQQNRIFVGGAADEGWNLGMSLVFYPGRCASGTHNGVYRQLFNVADNGDFASNIQARP